MFALPNEKSDPPMPHFNSTIKRCFAFTTIAVIICATAPQSIGAEKPTQSSKTQSTAATTKPTFDNVGPQVGEQLPNLRLQSTKGELQPLGAAWRSGPALIVTSSLTCPKSRSRWPQLSAIAKKYGEKLNVVIVYVIEAHPVGSVCPYKGVEDITPENHRDGILRKQPNQLDDRLELAQEFKRYLRIDVPIYVDLLDNRAWKALGAAPNIAFLVREGGVVTARQGWFDGPAFEASIDECLSKLPSPDEHSQDWERAEKKAATIQKKLEQAGFEPWDLNSAFEDNNAADLAKILKKVPEVANLIIEPAQGHPQETTLLMDAVAQGNVVAAELLLKHGADIHARTSSFDSPLQAARFDNLDIVKLLLRHRANVNYPATGRSPIHEALISGHTDAARLLIDAGAKEDFYSDIALGKIDAVRESLDSDPSRAARPDGASRMPLDYAAANNQLELAKLLVKYGAPIVDYNLSPMKVPLHYAIQIGNAPMVELLLDAGNSPNTAEGRGGESATSEPALHMAISEDHLEIVKLLLAHKPDLTIRNTYSQTPLHYAANLGKAKIVELLIQAGADVKATTLSFSLPCGSGEEETPQLNTPLHFAAAAGNPETIKALLAGGAEIDAPNTHGITPLMSALSPPLYTGINDDTQLKNIECLLSSGANAKARDKQGQTPLDLASDSDAIGNPNSPEEQKKLSQSLIALLKKHGAKPSK